ncbi:hypothetical protein BGZ46_004909 [Entomortierella lignicola]|nr:hypothetical protein BGZ46_004909 [Entomortierella lignicola]
MTRQEPESEGKVSRSYSLASAPLRLLSHSFHSTTNSHASGNSLVSSPAHFPLDRPYFSDSPLKESSSITNPQQQDVDHVFDISDKITGLEPSNTQIIFDNHFVPVNSVPVPVHASKLRHPEQLHQTIISDTDSFLENHNTHQRPYRKATKLYRENDIDLGQRSTCKLLYWATSDQSIWRKLALNLIQGEFYFDIPRTLPTNIPSWKFFCKRHLLRQRNWRQGHVQDVISLDDNYQKLTTLQITAPYVLTGCNDGRVHLWNINSRKLLHRFQIHGEITWVEHLQDQQIVAGLGYDLEKMTSEIRLFSTESGEQIGFYKESFWDLAICAINKTYLVASNGEGLYTVWDWKAGTKVSHFKVAHEESITECLYLIHNTIIELHYDGSMRLFSIHGECYGRLTLDNILPNHDVSFCWLHNDYSMVVWESSNRMAHIRLPLLMQNNDGQSESSQRGGLHNLSRPISQEEWDAQGAEVYWRHQLQHRCNFAAMGGGRFQLLYVEIFENLMDQVPIRVHSLKPIKSIEGVSATNTDDPTLEEGHVWHHGEYVTAHSLNPDLEKIIQGLRPSRVDCDPEYIVVGLVEGGVRLLQFAPVDEDLFEQT